MNLVVSRRSFLATAAAGMALAAQGARSQANTKQPNFLFAIADDWSWPHASALGAKEINTPNFDRVVKEGCLFTNTMCAAPQCSPNRAALLTGRYIWQIEEAGTHASIFPRKYPVFTDVLRDGGYHVGYSGKAWGPGDWKRGGFEMNPVGNEYDADQNDTPPADGINSRDYAADFNVFMDERDEEAPFFFWYGCKEPHRRYEDGSGAKEGKDPARAEVPSFLPDHEITRNDMLDYYLEIEWFDEHLGRMMGKLEEMGELENTIVVVTSDNGMPFPGAKANLYDHGIHVPLAIRYPDRFGMARSITDLISFIDLGPTFLDLAGLSPTPSMTGRSFAGVLEQKDAEGLVDPSRHYALSGRERHTHARYDNWGYPGRCLRTDRYLYIRNFKPDRWPAGDPDGDDGYYDIDACPSKTFLMEQREKYPEYFQRSFGKRPEEELFDIQSDPGCMKNLVDDESHESIRAQLAARLAAMLLATKDPRVLGTGDIFESYPRVSSMRPQLGGFAERGEYNPAYAPTRD